MYKVLSTKLSVLNYNLRAILFYFEKAGDHTFDNGKEHFEFFLFSERKWVRSLFEDRSIEVKTGNCDYKAYIPT